VTTPASEYRAATTGISTRVASSGAGIGESRGLDHRPAERRDRALHPLEVQLAQRRTRSPATRQQMHPEGSVTTFSEADLTSAWSTGTSPHSFTRTAVSAKRGS
jgi:hypothetical protein